MMKMIDLFLQLNFIVIYFVTVYFFNSLVSLGAG